MSSIVMTTEQQNEHLNEALIKLAEELRVQEVETSKAHAEVAYYKQILLKIVR